MPKSKREKLLHMTQVSKKTREHKDRLFTRIRDAVPEYQYCYVVRLDNLRNQHLQEVRQALKNSRLFLGKTKLMARALGTAPEDALAPGIDGLAARYFHGSVGLLCSNTAPADVEAALAAIHPVDFARAGTVAPRAVVVPRGVLYSSAGTVPSEDDVPVSLALEPELRRLGMPTRLLNGKVVLEAAPEAAAATTEETDGQTTSEEDNTGSGSSSHFSKDGYVICRAGQTLDSRQSRLLRLFSICLSEFSVEVLAYWTAATGEVTELVPPPSTVSGSKSKTKTGGEQDAGEDVAIEDADEQ
ncbi:60S acidic ribosomal protein [Niveomyces insectorum RCEF 264]|uniref:Ribosome assembly factor mrt4 n=1 Tax=Niveomyces insectorum RCEF 264 TaxID=1081102 RepID=A0A167MAQ1_9HYPO|nr:60S acidic ribosomal protein [Niveomyces insectorum RCEF 264]